MTKSKASIDGLTPEGVTEPATVTVQADEAPKATDEVKPGSAVATQEPPPVQEQQSGEVFPSPHVIYLGVVRNQLEADLMRFNNGKKMLTARLDGEQVAYEDESRVLKEEYERKRQERMDAHLSDMTRLKIQLGDISDVIETYETAIDKVGQINERQVQIDAAAKEAIK